MTRTRVAAVSYLNTIPFIYGIEHGASALRAELVLSPPSGCAAALADGRADVALLPVGALASFPDLAIITPYCIGADGPVRTVVLAANGPVAGIETIYLDSHSITSARLVQLLARELWGIDPRWEPLTDYTLPEKADPRTGYLLIGDKVFDLESRFTHRYDLAQAWRELTGLPFAFAVWTARPGVDAATVAALEEALGYGVAHIGEAVEVYGYASRPYALDYLTHNIDFTLDADKRRAIALYRQKAQEADPPADPG